MDKSLLAVVEAKKDDFEGGWAQCAFEMYAMQTINGTTEIPVFGIVSNGDQWEFARLSEKTFTKMPRFVPLDTLYSILFSMMKTCGELAGRKF